MTDFEAFKTMLERGRASNELSLNVKYAQYDNGPTWSLVFKIGAGLFGSEGSLGEAFFKKDSGEFLGIHHCD